MGHGPEGELDGVDALQDHDLGEVRLLSGLLGSVPLQQRLGKQHPGNADNCHDDEEFLEECLASVHVGGLTLRGEKDHVIVLEEDHVDEGDQDGGSTSFGGGDVSIKPPGRVGGPLVGRGTSFTVSFGAAELASAAAAAAAAVWAAMAAVANLSINALCSAMRSSSGRACAAAAAPKSGLARAICHKWVWAKSGLSRACLWKGKLWKPGVDINGKVGGNPE